MRRNNSLSHMLLGAALTLGASQAMALKELDDSSLSEVQGAGLAFPFDEFRFEMAPTSYIELVGNDTIPTETTFVRGDLRYYGMSMTRATEDGVLQTGGVDWQGNPCSGGFRGLGCPMNEGFIENFSTYDNPYMWRAFNYTGHEPDSDGTQTNDRAVFEILGPSNMDTFRWAFWGEVESGRTYNPATNGLATINGANCDAGTGSNCLTQLQNIIIGKPTALEKPRSVFGGESTSNRNLGPALRFFQYAGTTGPEGENPATYGLQYLSRLSGDYRLSINTTSDTAPQRGVIPDFTNEEGLYFTDVQAYLPLGQLHYQALVFDNAQPGSTNIGNQDGNIVIELTRIPDVGAVFNDFYSLAPGDTEGYQRTNRPDRYYETHGYVEWGDAFPTNPNPNGLGGSGVSQVRFAGAGAPDLFLSGRAVNAGNFPGDICGGGRTDSCDRYNGTAPSITVPGTAITSSSSREDIVEEGGIVFLSRSGGGWTVLNNQNQDEGFDVNTREVMLARTNATQGGLFSCGLRRCRDLGARTAGNVDFSAIAQQANEGGYNPVLNVNAINLGTARVEGLQINHLKIETLGGGN